MRRTFVLVVLVGIGLVLCVLLVRDERSVSGRSEKIESDSRHGERGVFVASAAVPEISRAAVSESRGELLNELPRVRGKVLVEDGGALGEAVELQVDVYRGLFGEPADALVPVAADGTFDFPVSMRTTHVMLELRAQELFTPFEVRAVPGEEALVVAQRRTQVTRTRGGWTLTGRVLDQDGLPFVGARVFAVPPPDPGGHGPRSDTAVHVQAEALSAEDGRFELVGLRLVHLRVRATSIDAVGSAEVDVDAENDDVHDLVLTLARGGCIRGQVRWQDGTLVRKFQCGARSKKGGRSASFSNGNFELCGLAPDLQWSVHAFAQEEGRSGSGEVGELRTDGLPIDIVLMEHGPSFALEVNVQDEHGAPVEGFHVWANTSDGRMRNLGAGSSSEGRVVMPGLTAGLWTLSVRAPGFASTDRSVDLTPGSPPLTVVLARSALIRGIVRGVDGKLVIGAVVEAHRALEDGGVRVDWRMSEAVSDVQGLFELEVPPGSGQIFAGGIDDARSVPLDYEVASGQTLEGFVLTLE